MNDKTVGCHLKRGGLNEEKAHGKTRSGGNRHGAQRIAGHFIEEDCLRRKRWSEWTYRLILLPQV